MNTDWSEFEVIETVKDYFAMLSMQIKNIPYRKSDHRRALRIKLSQRSEGAIEFKHQNISAVLIKYKKPYIIGYKPRMNYQMILEAAVLQYLEDHPAIINDFEHFSIEVPGNEVVNFSKWKADFTVPLTFEEPQTTYERRFSEVDYLAREQANKRLGDLGEELILNYEKWRLKNEGTPELAKEIVWVAKDLGDGAGYDILSKNRDGSDRFIEVKTTKLGKLTPIYFTRNELLYSQSYSASYYLYRIFEYGKRAKFFDLCGRLDKMCKVEPINFVGRFN